MDPYSAEGELVNIHTAFHQGQYQKVVDFDTSSFSSSNEVPARLLKLRAQLALGQHDDVLSQVKGDNTPDLKSVACLAKYLKKPDSEGPAVEEAKSLAESQGDSLGVQICCGTVLSNAGLQEEALALLSKHQGSLDAVALIIQIHLSQNRTDLASKEAKNARKFAQDSLLVNLAESWVGMREGGDKYQQAFYVFEELAQAPSTQATRSLVGQAVSEMHLGRLPEAEAALKQAMELEPESADVLSNAIVLNTVLGNDTEELQKKLQSVEPKHQFLEDVVAKREAFEQARAKYTPKFEP